MESRFFMQPGRQGEISFALLYRKDMRRIGTMRRRTDSQNMILLIIVALFWFAQYAYIPYQTTYLTVSGAAGSIVGIAVGAYGILQLILRLPVGVCADRVGRHRPFIMACSGFFCVMSGDLWLRICCRVLPLPCGSLLWYFTRENSEKRISREPQTGL